MAAKIRHGRSAKKVKQPLRSERKVEREIGIAPKIPKQPMHASGRIKKQQSGFTSSKKMHPLLGLV